jgi:hypothetical protein
LLWWFAFLQVRQTFRDLKRFWDVVQIPWRRWYGLGSRLAPLMLRRNGNTPIFSCYSGLLSSEYALLAVHMGK